MIPRYTKFGSSSKRVFLGWSWEKFGRGCAEPVDVYYLTEFDTVQTMNKRYGGSTYMLKDALNRFPQWADRIEAIAAFTINERKN